MAGHRQNARCKDWVNKMEFGKVIDIFAAIVSVAMAFVIVSSPNTSGIITAFGNSFSGGLRAAMGH